MHCTKHMLKFSKIFRIRMNGSFDHLESDCQLRQTQCPIMTDHYNNERDYEVHNVSGCKDRIRIKSEYFIYYFFIISITG